MGQRDWRIPLLPCSLKSSFVNFVNRMLQNAKYIQQILQKSYRRTLDGLSGNSR